MMSFILSKDKKIFPVVQDTRRINSTTPERVAGEETKKFEETSKRLKELKELIPQKNKNKAF